MIKRAYAARLSFEDSMRKARGRVECSHGFRSQQVQYRRVVQITDVDRARSFYRDTLGLNLVSEELPYALVFDANGIMLRLAFVKEKPSFPGTVLGWNVPDATAAARSLQQAGVQFERYGFMKQDELGIWTTPTGARVAWFKDPDGNVLSISQHPERV